MTTRICTRGMLFLTLLIGFHLAAVARAGSTNLYSTTFELPFFDSAYELDTQDGWFASGTGGTGLFMDGIFTGQSAFVGGYPPTNTNNETSVWFPLAKDPLEQGYPVVLFSVDFAIWSSTAAAPNADEFRWSAVNRDEQPLFELIFDSLNGKILYQLNNGTAAIDTLQTFATNTAHRLTVRMDFLNNRWSAVLSNEVTRAVSLLVTNQPVSAGTAALTLGDMDASWVIIDPALPGDNLMEFDNYTLIGEGPGAFVLGPPTLTSTGEVQLVLQGEAGNSFILESRDNSPIDPSPWVPVSTNRSVNGSIQFTDPASSGLANRFYRARWQP